jgi:hypothetical protein
MPGLIQQENTIRTSDFDGKVGTAQTSCCKGPPLLMGGEGPSASPLICWTRWSCRPRPSRAGPSRPGRGKEELSPPTTYRDYQGRRPWTQRRDPVAPVSRHGREDLWLFSAASGASHAPDFELLASFHEKSRSLITSAAIHCGGNQGCSCRHGLLYLHYGRRSVSFCAFPLLFSHTFPAPSSTRRRSSALPGPLDLLRVP